MDTRPIKVERETRETNIRLSLDLDSKEKGDLALTGVPFFLHLLEAMSFHGGFRLDIAGTGDIDVDPHHLVEDAGLVLGDALAKTVETYGPVARFAHQVIPMDEAVSEVSIDVSGRPFIRFDARFPQTYAGQFPVYLVAEFLTALSNRAKITLHAHCRYGENSHHMAESLFKALGKAVAQAYRAVETGTGERSTKGVI
jgi:imidazoleglycerol-phosphate dehydratase